MRTELNGELYDFHLEMLVASDMIENLQDRAMVYAVMKAAEKAYLHGLNPRKVFYAHKDSFPHIKLNMDCKNWDD